MYYLPQQSHGKLDASKVGPSLATVGVSKVKEAASRSRASGWVNRHIRQTSYQAAGVTCILTERETEEETERKTDREKTDY